MRLTAFGSDVAQAPDDPDFYSRLPPVAGFSDVFSDANYLAPPKGWLVVICRVEAAATAAKQGRYRDVNVTAAAAIAAVLNAVHVDIPYVFAGDGASFVIPPTCRAAVETALAGTRTMAREAFRLKLVAGIVPLADIRAAGHDLRVVRCPLGKITVAMFTGGGLAYAENIVRMADNYRLPADLAGWADFQGLECRWRPVTARRGSMLAVIVQARDGQAGICGAINAAIDDICAEKSPVSLKRLRLTLRPKHLRGEHRVRTHGATLQTKISYAARLIHHHIVGRLIFDFKANFKGLDGKALKEGIVKQADFQRYDNGLRMILDVTEEEQRKIAVVLQKAHEAGDIFYGTESGGAAQITCLSFDRAENHIHFVDGQHGGYALAKRAMQEQVRTAILMQFNQDREKLATVL